MDPIVQNGDPVLRTVAAPVDASEFGTPALAQDIEKMAQALNGEVGTFSIGVALAAPQIGISKRIFVVRYDRTSSKKPIDSTPETPELGVFINPRITKSSRRRVRMDEGCLSVRGLYGFVDRHDRVTVEAYDEHGKKFERGGGGLLAQVFQHEIGHLDGELFIDRAEGVCGNNPMNQTHNFVFFGTPYVARDTLAQLVAHGFIPSLVVTSPDAPRGRGMQLTPSETNVWAKEHDLPVITPEKLTPEVVEEIRAYGADYAVVVAYGKFLPQSLIDAFPKGAINVHYSLLPNYRGASPVEAALLAGDAVTGVAIQKMVKEMDAGDVLAVRELAIDPTETTRELRPRLITLGSELLTEILPAFERGELIGTPQDHTNATFAKKIEKAAGELDLAGDPKENWNKYRAFAESPGTYFFMEKNGTRIRVKIKTATFEHGEFIPERIVPEGKNETNYADFKNT